MRGRTCSFPCASTLGQTRPVPPPLLATLVAAVVAGPWMVLTALGERRRSRRWSVAVVAGLFFPVTWVAWYLRDERPYRSPAA
jgi:hypothetical protein